MTTSHLPTSSALAKLNACEFAAHKNVWTRFISTHGILLDYAGRNGEVQLPTPDECEKYIPNALAWWTPIENGAFFTGDYLLGLLTAYRSNPSPKLSSEIQQLISGLCRLQDVCLVPGVIARGVGSDGQCHYPTSSHDQIIPWLLGLWHYSNSGIPTSQEAADIRARIVRQLAALRNNHWIVPGEAPGFERGNFLGEDNALESWLASVHIALATRILDLLVPGDPIDDYSSTIHHRMKNGVRRIDWIAEGCPSFKRGYGWIVTHSMYAIRELHYQALTEEERHLYSQTLKVVGKAAAPYVTCWKEYAKYQNCGFTPDWHVMLPEYREQKSCQDADLCATPQHHLWCNAAPAIYWEKETLMHSFSAALLVILSNDAELIRETMPEILNALTNTPFHQLHYATFFFAENVIHELRSLAQH